MSVAFWSSFLWYSIFPKTFYILFLYFLLQGFLMALSPWAYDSSEDALLKASQVSFVNRNNFLLTNVWCQNPGFVRVTTTAVSTTATFRPEDNILQHSSPNSGSYTFSDSTSMVFSECLECSNIDVLIALCGEEKIVLWNIFMCLFTSSSNMKGICLSLSNQKVVFETWQRWLLKFIVSISWDSTM